MKKNIISIDQSLCIGCGLCVNTCHQGALQLVNGKATLLSEDYCDGLGRCLPNCPTGALKIVEKEVELENIKKSKCPSINPTMLEKNLTASSDKVSNQSELKQWPCQIKLVPTTADYFHNADLLVAADCTAFANGNVHNLFMKDKITIIGCPKLDSVDYSEKIADIVKNNEIKSVTVLRMSVPCCGGIENAVKNALIATGKEIPHSTVIVSPNGSIL